MTLTGHGYWEGGLGELPNGNLASGSADGTVKIWNTDTGALLQTLTGHYGGIGALAVLANGYIASASYQTIEIWN